MAAPEAPVQSHAGPERVDDSAVALDIPAPVAPEPSRVEDAEQSPAVVPASQEAGLEAKSRRPSALN